MVNGASGKGFHIVGADIVLPSSTPDRPVAAAVTAKRAHDARPPRPDAAPSAPGASLSALNKFRPTAQAPRPAPNVWDEMCTELVQEVGSHLRIDDKAALANTAAGFKTRLPGAAEEQGLYSRAMRQTPADHLMRPDVKASDYQIGTALTALDKTVHPQDRTALTDRMLSAAEIGVSMLQAPAAQTMIQRALASLFGPPKTPYGAEQAVQDALTLFKKLPGPSSERGQLALAIAKKTHLFNDNLPVKSTVLKGLFAELSHTGRKDLPALLGVLTREGLEHLPTQERPAAFDQLLSAMGRAKPHQGMMVAMARLVPSLPAEHQAQAEARLNRLHQGAV